MKQTQFKRHPIATLVAFAKANPSQVETIASEPHTVIPAKPIELQRVWATFARIPGAPSSFNLARKMTQAEAKRLADRYASEAKEKRFPHEFGFHVSDVAPL